MTLTRTRSSLGLHRHCSPTRAGIRHLGSSYMRRSANVSTQLHAQQIHQKVEKFAKYHQRNTLAATQRITYLVPRSVLQVEQSTDETSEDDNVIGVLLLEAAMPNCWEDLAVDHQNVTRPLNHTSTISAKLIRSIVSSSRSVKSAGLVPHLHTWSIGIATSSCFFRGMGLPQFTLFWRRGEFLWKHRDG